MAERIDEPEIAVPKIRELSREAVLGPGVDIAEEDIVWLEIAVDQALTRLAQWDARLAQIVEMRFFAGLTEEETGEVLGISPRTVSRDWLVAKAWLHGELSGTTTDDSGSVAES